VRQLRRLDQENWPEQAYIPFEAMSRAVCHRSRLESHVRADVKASFPSSDSGDSGQANGSNLDSAILRELHCEDRVITERPNRMLIENNAAF
jgi:hypothetical protein